MVQMARFVKPILAAMPPDQGRIDPRQWLPLAGPSAAASPSCRGG